MATHPALWMRAAAAAGAAVRAAAAAARAEGAIPQSAALVAAAETCTAAASGVRAPGRARRGRKAAWRAGAASDIVASRDESSSGPEPSTAPSELQCAPEHDQLKRVFFGGNSKGAAGFEPEAFFIGEPSGDVGTMTELQLDPLVPIVCFRGYLAAEEAGEAGAADSGAPHADEAAGPATLIGASGIDGGIISFSMSVSDCAFAAMGGDASKSELVATKVASSGVAVAPQSAGQGAQSEPVAMMVASSGVAVPPQSAGDGQKSGPTAGEERKEGQDAAGPPPSGPQPRRECPTPPAFPPHPLPCPSGYVRHETWGARGGEKRLPGYLSPTAGFEFADGPVDIVAISGCDGAGSIRDGTMSFGKIDGDGSPDGASQHGMLAQALGASGIGVGTMSFGKIGNDGSPSDAELAQVVGASGIGVGTMSAGKIDIDGSTSDAELARDIGASDIVASTMGFGKIDIDGPPGGAELARDIGASGIGVGTMSAGKIDTDGSLSDAVRGRGTGACGSGVGTMSPGKIDIDGSLSDAELATVIGASGIGVGTMSFGKIDIDGSPSDAEPAPVVGTSGIGGGTMSIGKTKGYASNRNVAQVYHYGLVYDVSPVIAVGMNPLRLPAFFESLGHSNVILDAAALVHKEGEGRGAAACDRAEQAWRMAHFNIPPLAGFSFAEALLEYAQIHEELKGAFETFQEDADQLYPGWREKLRKCRRG